MYSPLGMIVGRFEAAVKERGMKTFLGPDASMQSPDVPDLLARNTSGTLLQTDAHREAMRVALVKSGGAGTARAARAVAWMNASCNLKALCREFPQRLADVQQAEGVTLRK